MCIFIFKVYLFNLGNFPHSCVTQCRCYSNHYKGNVVANCSYSGLTHIPDSLPEQTDWLLLAGNNISSLKTESNDTLYHLSQLDLYDNSISNISFEAIDHFIQTNTLMYLNISKNQLRNLPENIKNLTSLTTLKIHGNIFECSCENFWMKEWLLNETQIVDDYKNIKCQMKSEKWIPVVRMDKADMGCVHSSEDMFALWKIIGKPHVPFFVFFKSIKWNIIT